MQTQQLENRIDNIIENYGQNVQDLKKHTKHEQTEKAIKQVSELSEKRVDTEPEALESAYGLLQAITTRKSLSINQKITIKKREKTYYRSENDRGIFVYGESYPALPKQVVEHRDEIMENIKDGAEDLAEEILDLIEHFKGKARTSTTHGYLASTAVDGDLKPREETVSKELEEPVNFSNSTKKKIYYNEGTPKSVKFYTKTYHNGSPRYEKKVSLDAIHPLEVKALITSHEDINQIVNQLKEQQEENIAKAQQLKTVVEENKSKYLVADKI